MYLMHRDSFIIEQIVVDSNMEEAFDKVLRGDERKNSTEGRKLLAQKKETLDKIKSEIVQGTFKVVKYENRDILEGGKWRRIQITSMERRIGVFAIMNVVDTYFKKRFIRTTGASIKGRGTHDLEECIRRDMAADPEGMKYCYEFDIVQFYDNIMPEFVMYCLRRVFKDDRLLRIMDSLLHMIPQGISKGLRSSQGLSNLLLSTFLDHYLKDTCGVSHFYRYCDDGRIFSGQKLDLWMGRDIVHERTALIDLQIKGNERVFQTRNGVDFLGYVTYSPEFVKLRKRVKKNFARKFHKVKSRRRRKQLIACFYGIAKHANCNNLFYKLTGKTMKSFKDLKVAYKPEDGKKRFPGAVVSIRELVNLPIVVKDFETGIKTEQGEDRCIVAIEQNGEAKKFFTNSEEMKNILAQIREMPDGFPFETTIKTETFGKGRTKYVFS